MPGNRAVSVHLLTLAPQDPERREAELESHWEGLLKLRSETLKLLETMRQAGAIGAPLEAAVSLGAAGGENGTLGDALVRQREALKELFIVSEVGTLSLADTEDLRRRANGAETFSLDGAYGRIMSDPPLLIVGRRARGRKCQRCWMYFDDDSGWDLDPRCRAVVQALTA